MKKTKYEKLEGKVIDFVYSDNEVVKGLVVGVDPDIGITIVQNDNHKYNLLCLIGPSSPRWEEHWDPGPERFEFICDQIKKGFIDSNDLRANPHTGGVPAEYCSFNQ